jgi:hypothetical protein
LPTAAVAIALAGSTVPRLEDATLGTRVLAFGLGISAVAVLLAGALPALVAARATPMDLLRHFARGRRSRLQRWLVLAELTIAIVALAVTARLVRAVLDLDTLAFGFHPQGVLNAQVLPSTKDWTRWNAFYDEFLTRVRALPGVDAAGAVSLRPLRYEAIGTDTNVVLAGQSMRYESWKDNPIVNFSRLSRQGTSRRWGFRRCEAACLRRRIKRARTASWSSANALPRGSGPGSIRSDNASLPARIAL